MNAPVRKAGPKFEQALISKRSKLLSYAISLAKKRDAAEDLVQDTMVLALSNFDKFTAGTNLEAWLFVILRNRFLSSRRKAAREVEDVDGCHSSKVAAADNQNDQVDLDRVQSLIDDLPAEQASAIRAIASGMQYDEYAAKAGIAIGTAKSRVNRARTAVMHRIEHTQETVPVTALEAPTELRKIDPKAFEDTAKPRPLDEHGKRPDLSWLLIENLRIDPRYQRDIVNYGRSNVHKIAREFDWAKFGTVVVAPLDSGLYAIVDGQHRTTAAAICGISSVPCQIITASPGEQAAAFAAINGNTTKMMAQQVHAAKVAAGDQDALRLEKACKEAGVKILRYPLPISTIGVGQTMAVVALAQCLRQYGHDVLVCALRCLVEGNHGNRGAIRGPVVKALCAAIHHNPKLVRGGRALAASANIRFLHEFNEASAIAKADRVPSMPVLTDRLRKLFDSYQARMAA